MSDLLGCISPLCFQFMVQCLALKRFSVKDRSVCFVEIRPHVLYSAVSMLTTFTEIREAGESSWSIGNIETEVHFNKINFY